MKIKVDLRRKDPKVEIRNFKDVIIHKIVLNSWLIILTIKQKKQPIKNKILFNLNNYLEKNF